MKLYEMTEKQRADLMAASQPVAMIVGSGGVPPRSPQESANSFWRALGAELGFDWRTARPVPGKGDTFFEAEELRP